ncbi:MAG: flagellar biosynthetic protein FliO [Halieaceae bacterium]|jgi:flagellar protein FliO/FliZ|nr:flagellar biosynthetic protein FliO [Halieaceae bacterium]
MNASLRNSAALAAVSAALLFGPLASSPALAAAPAASSAAPEIFSASYLFQVLGSLLFVFACLFVLVYFMRRFNGPRSAQGHALRVLASASVGQRERVVLVEVGDKQLLLGVAPGSVRALHALDEPVLAPQESTPPQAQDFAAILRAANPLGARS